MDKAQDKDKQSDNNDANGNGEAVEREVEITIPGLLRALSTSRVGENRPATREIPLDDVNGEKCLLSDWLILPICPFQLIFPAKAVIPDSGCLHKGISMEFIRSLKRIFPRMAANSSFCGSVMPARRILTWGSIWIFCF
jgi:hypothetical protein